MTTNICIQPSKTCYVIFFSGIGSDTAFGGGGAGLAGQREMDKSVAQHIFESEPCNTNFAQKRLQNGQMGKYHTMPPQPPIVMSFPKK